MEVIAFVWTERYKTCSHCEAVEVSADVAVHVRDFLESEII